MIMKKIMLILLIISIIACSFAFIGCKENKEPEKEIDYFDLNHPDYMYLFYSEIPNHPERGFPHYLVYKNASEMDTLGGEEIKEKYNDNFFEDNILIIIHFQYYFGETNIRLLNTKCIDGKVLVNIAVDSPNAPDGPACMDTLYMDWTVYVEVPKSEVSDNFDLGVLVINDSGIPYRTFHYDCRRK